MDDLTPQQQIDQYIDTGRAGSWLGNQVNGDWHSGGGGAGGGYRFSGLADLDRAITQWEELAERIVRRSDRLKQAIGLIVPPARDGMSVRQADAFRNSLEIMHGRVERMRAYAEGFIAKLTAARQDYAAHEESAAVRMRAAGEELRDG